MKTGNRDALIMSLACGAAVHAPLGAGASQSELISCLVTRESPVLTGGPSAWRSGDFEGRVGEQYLYRQTFLGCGAALQAALKGGVSLRGLKRAHEEESPMLSGGAGARPPADSEGCVGGLHRHAL